MDPSYLWRWPLMWIGWWQQRVGTKGVVLMLLGGTVLAVILNYKL